MKGPVPEGIGPFAFRHANDPEVFKVVKVRREGQCLPVAWVLMAAVSAASTSASVGS